MCPYVRHDELFGLLARLYAQLLSHKAEVRTENLAKIERLFHNIAAVYIKHYVRASVMMSFLAAEL